MEKWCRFDRSACSPAVQYATTVPPIPPGGWDKVRLEKERERTTEKDSKRERRRDWGGRSHGLLVALVLVVARLMVEELYITRWLGR